MSNDRSLRVGLCGIGLEAYWAQFAGLKERLEGHVEQVAARLRQAGAEVVSLGLVDSAPRSSEAGHRCRREDIEVLFLYATTYALSNTVLPLVRRAGVPVIVLNLQPGDSIDYAAFNRMGDRTAMTGHWLAYCAACPVPEIANVLARAGFPFHQVTGFLGDTPTWRETEEWVAAARVRSALASLRLGLMGNYYGGMLDIMTDTTLVSVVFGTHLELLEVDELSGLRPGFGEAEVARRAGELREALDVQPDCAPEELARAARTSLALDALVERHDLGALAYYHKGSGNPPNEDTMSSIILGTSLLTARHIPVAGEYEVKNALAMKILDTLGCGGSFTECYAIDFGEDLVLMGHDGPGHIAISQGRTKVRPLSAYHGKVGRGLSVEMSVRFGPVTLLSVAEDREQRFRLQVAEGQCVDGAILEIGNTNSRYKFPLGARGFVDAWNAGAPAHHCAVGVGHVASTLRKAAALMGIGFNQVC
jgi:L-arabinose isomerase